MDVWCNGRSGRERVHAEVAELSGRGKAASIGVDTMGELVEDQMWEDSSEWGMGQGLKMLEVVIEKEEAEIKTVKEFSFEIRRGSLSGYQPEDTLANVRRY